MVKCPYCGYEGEFKLIKTWKYSWWGVFLYECPKCGGRFRYYVDPTGKHKSYVVMLGAKKTVKCPYCGYEGEFRLLKTWRYSWWDVYFYECPKCSARFASYVDPEGKRKSFVILFKPRARARQ